MKKTDILEFLTTGNHLQGIRLNDPVDKLFEKLGTPKEQVGTTQFGFFHYKQGLRFGYFDKVINELVILFRSKKSPNFAIKNPFNEILIISGETKIHEFIYLLNTMQIGWKCPDQKDLSGFIMVINDEVVVFFDLDSGNLTRIFVGRR